MQLVVLGLNHRSAAVEVRERFSFEKNEVESALNRLYEYEKISECVILSTCNRTEIYAVLEDVQSPKAYMLDVLKHLKHADTIDESAFFFYEEKACIEHLFRVSASLDSLVLGEGQILSQLKGAYIAAYRALREPYLISCSNALLALVKRFGPIQALRIHLCLLAIRRLTWRKIA